MKAAFIALAAAASLSQVSATFGGFHNAPPFACPGNSDNVCEEKQKGGWNWGDLTPGKFDNYDGFHFKGWTCEDKSSKKKIAGRCGPEPSKAPSFECGPTKKKFSVKKFELDVEFDCRIEFHYDMPDGSVCKHAQECKAGGNVVHNTQCGGAKKVRFVYPTQPNKPKECNIGVGHIDFDCDNNTPSKPPYNPGKPPHHPGKPPHNSPPTSSPVVPPAVTESSALPVESTTVPVPEESTTTPAPEESTTVSVPEESTTVSVPGESTVPAPEESTTVSVPGESTVPAPEESTTVSVPEESTTVPPAGETTTTEPVFITSSIPAGSSTVPVPEESTTISVPGESTVPAPEESTASVPGESTVPAPAESTSTAPGSETTVSSALPVESTTPGASSTPEVSTPPAVPTTLTTVYDTTSTVFTTSVQTITSCGPEVPDCPAKGTTAVVTVTIPVSTTICPVTETITTVPGVPTQTAPVTPPQSPETPETPQTPETPDDSEEDLPCPAVVPKCLNTFFYLVDSCRDNTDAACYCPNKDYVDEVFKCLYAHGESGDIIAEAVNFFQGICADKIPENPAIITGADDITQHITITGTPVVPSAVYTTVIVDATVTAPAVVDGTTIVGSSTTVVISTEVTVPQVTLPTAAATEPAAGVPEVPAVPTLITSRPVLTGTGGVPIPSSPVVPINGASSVRGGMAIGAIVMAVLAAF